MQIGIQQGGVGILRTHGWLVDLPDEQVTGKALKQQLKHQLLLNWFRVHLLQVTKVRPMLKADFLSSTSPFQKSVQYEGPSITDSVALLPNRQKVELIPDGIFILAHTEQHKTLLFFLEVDLGTEPLDRKGKGQDIHSKLLKYQAYFSSGKYKRYEELWDCELHGFRLLILTVSPNRLNRLCDLVQRTPPKDFVWLTDRDTLFRHGLTGDLWFRGGDRTKPRQSILNTALSCSAPIPNL